MISPETEATVPAGALNSLMTMAVIGAAQYQVDKSAANKAYDVLHPGDSFGRVMAWAFTTDPHAAMIHLAQYVHDIQVHVPQATLMRLLDGFRLGLPGDFTAQQREDFVQTALREVPAHYESVLR